MDEKVSNLINKIKETAAIAADAAEAAAKRVSQRTGETLELAKLNMKIFDLNTEIGVNQREIGKIVYETHTGKETNEEALAGILTTIDEKYAEIEIYKTKIAELKKGVACPSCGETCGKGDMFCKKCGATVNK